MTQRGSAYLYVLLVAASLTVFILLASTMSAQNYSVSSRRVSQVMAREVFDAAVEQVLADRDNRTLAVPSSRTLTLNGVSCTVTVADNSASLAKSFKVSATVTAQRQSFAFSRIVGGNEPDAFTYALAVDGNVSTASQLTTGALGSNGATTVNGSVSLTNSLTTINGNLEAANSIAPITLLVTGTKYENYGTKRFTFPSSSPYQDVASSSSNGATINGFTFASVSPGQPYPVHYMTGSVSVRGTFSGVGTIVVNGDLTYSANTTYANSSSRVAWIVMGNLNLTGRSVVGYHSVNGTTSVTGLSSITSGGLVTKTYSQSAAFSTTLDPTVKNNPNEGVRLRLPGYW